MVNILKKSISWCAAILAMIFTLYILLFTNAGASGAVAGMKLALTAVVPSLFPFMVLSSVIMGTPLANLLAKFTYPLTKYIFKCPPQYGGTILFSMVGGYPLGAKLLSDMLSANQTDKQSVSRLLCYCVNPGPAFTISVVGTVFLGNTGAGFIIFISQILAVILSALFFSKKDVEFKKDNIANKYKSFPFTFACSVTTSAISIINVVAFIAIFSAICSVLEQANLLSWAAKYISSLVPLSFIDFNFLQSFLNGILEVSAGCAKAILASPIGVLPLVSWLCAFGGISVICQVYGMFKEEINMVPFIISRFFTACLSALITILLGKIFPFATMVNSVASPPIMYYDSSTAILSLCMLTMSFMVLLNLSLKLNDKHYIKSR